MVVGSHRQAPVTFPTRRRPGMHFEGGWACSRAGLDGYGKSRPNRNSIPGPSSPWRVPTLPTPSRPNRYSKKWVILINSLHWLSPPSILYSLWHSFLSSLSFILPCLLECGHDHFVEGSCVRFVFLKSMYDTSRSLLAVYMMRLQAVCTQLTPTAVTFLWAPARYRIDVTRMSIILLRLYVIRRCRNVKLIRAIPATKDNTSL
jgi:hypothetical protein